MWIRIRAVIVEDEPLAAQYLAALLEDTCQVEIVGSATESEAGLRLCAELRPDAVFVDINLPGKDGVSLATQLAMLPQPPRLVFTTGSANRATDAFRLEAVDYLLKPLDPEQVTEAVNRLLAYLRPMLRQDFGPLSPWGSFVRARRQIDQLIYDEIAERRTHPDASRNDILTLLMCARDEAGEALTDAELRDELITLLMAGHETTATAITWALSGFELALADSRCVRPVRRGLTSGPSPFRMVVKGHRPCPRNVKTAPETS
jgi:DNA-binding NarL/FixJ family response regulator